MGFHYKPLDPGEARDILNDLVKAQEDDERISVDRESGECVGPKKRGDVDPNRINLLGGRNTHYASESSADRAICKLLDNDARLVMETRAVRERHGDGPRLTIEDGVLEWRYDLPVHGSIFPIRIIYPTDYPNEPPTIKALGQFPAGTPHLLKDNVLCWIWPGEKKRKRNAWQPGFDTAAEAIMTAYQWLLTFMVWDVTGVWAFPDARD